jgi:hypothetical protein
VGSRQVDRRGFFKRLFGEHPGSYGRSGSQRDGAGSFSDLLFISRRRAQLALALGCIARIGFARRGFDQGARRSDGFTAGAPLSVDNVGVALLRRTV